MSDYTFVSLFPYFSLGVGFGLGIGCFVWILSYSISRALSLFKIVINM